MSSFTQTTTQTMNHNAATQMAAWTTAAMAMMPSAKAREDQQAAQSEQTQRQQTQTQSQTARAQSPSFTQAENIPVFCFFYFHQPSPTHFTKRSQKIVKRLGEIMNHAHKGGARI
jgi:cell envelope opacity-associated protein A